jgi:branched-chain amino acid transport system permease protein
MGFLACRLGGLPVFLVTFALAESLFLFVMADPIGITNSEDGIAGIPRKALLGFINIETELNYYYLVLVVVLLCYLALRAITKMPFGDTLMAVRENPQRARFLGYRVRQYRIASFVVSGFFASLAGALIAFHEHSVAPEMFGVFESGFALIYTILGGAGTLVGPILGVAILVIIIEILSDLFEFYMIFVGLTLVFLIMFLPNGIYPLLQGIRLKKPKVGQPESISPPQEA